MQTPLLSAVNLHDDSILDGNHNAAEAQVMQRVQDRPGNRGLTGVILRIGDWITHEHVPAS
jgi:hypothetical protein